MTRAEAIAYGRTIAGAAGLVALILGAQGLVDRLERDHEDRLAYRQWVADACTPAAPDQTAIVKRDGPRLRCSIFIRAEHGLAPQLISVAVMEVPL